MSALSCNHCGHPVEAQGLPVGTSLPCPHCEAKLEKTEGGLRVKGHLSQTQTMVGRGSQPSRPSASSPTDPEGPPPVPVRKAFPPSLVGAPSLIEGNETGPDLPPTPDEIPSEGQPIPGYQVLSELGRGGMAVVFQARQESLDRIVALKIMSKRLARDPDFVARFEREAKALAKLNHPNITSVYDRGQAKDKVYFVMEYVKGRSLRELLEEASGPLASDDVLNWMIQVARALSYVHSRGTIHRDIKPENVLVTAENEIKVTDFGLAAMTDRQSYVNLTADNMMMGTLNYMSPEQRADAKNVDHRTDIYSFGVMLYELLTGKVPIGQFEPASTLNPSLDLRLDNVISSCLKNDPEKRYPSIDPTLEALIEIQTTEPEEEGGILNIPLTGALDPSPAPPPPSSPPPPEPPPPKRPSQGRDIAQNQQLEALLSEAKQSMQRRRTRGHTGPNPKPGAPQTSTSWFWRLAILIALALGLAFVFRAELRPHLKQLFAHTPPSSSPALRSFDLV